MLHLPSRFKLTYCSQIELSRTSISTMLQRLRGQRRLATSSVWLPKIGKMVGLDDALPLSVNAGTEKPITHAATDLLKSHNVGISAQAFNRMLELKGVVKHATRPGKRGKVHSWYVITPAFDKYGQNQQDPKFQQQTQIRWYDATFMELLTIVGLNSQTSLNLN